MVGCSSGVASADRELLEIASEQRRTLIAIDTDFGQLVYLDLPFWDNSVACSRPALIARKTDV